MRNHSARHKVQPVLGNRLMAGQRSLDPLIKVRVLVPQPDKNARKGVFCCGARQSSRLQEKFANLRVSARQPLENGF